MHTCEGAVASDGNVYVATCVHAHRGQAIRDVAKTLYQIIKTEC